RERLTDELAQLRTLAEAGPVVLRDYETNTDVDDLRKPLSHAGLVRAWLLDAWPGSFSGMATSQDPVSAAVAYHQLSKHRLPNRYARSRGYLDWDTQPTPFRLYEGVDRVALIRDEPGGEDDPTLDQLYDPERVPAAPIDAGSVARLLFDSLASSAWKQHGEQRWSLRCNPSSANLHPTEAPP